MKWPEAFVAAVALLAVAYALTHCNVGLDIEFRDPHARPAIEGK